MQKVVFFTSIRKQYICLQEKIKRNYRTINALKLSITFLIFFLTIWVYGYFVNVSSTKWYFLRKQMQNVDDAKFQNSITQLEILKKEKELWDNIENNMELNKPKDPVKIKVLYISLDQELSKKLSMITK